MFTLDSMLDQLILTQQRAIRYYLFFAAALILLGIAIMSVATVLSPLIAQDAFRALFGLGGAFVSSLSAFQIKEIVTRQGNIHACQMWKEMLRTLEGATDTEGVEAQRRITEMIWRAVENWR